MKTGTKKKLSLLSVLAVVTFFAYYIGTHVDDFKQISLANPAQLLLLTLLTLVTTVLNGLTIKYLAEPFRIELDPKEWFGLATVTTFYNTIMPLKSGMFVKAAYLKKKHSFSLVNFMAMMAGIAVINFFVVGLVGLASLVVIYFRYGIFNALVTSLFLGMLLVTGGIIGSSRKIPETTREFLNRFIRVVNGWHLIKSNPKILAVSTVIALLQLLTSAFATMLSFRVIHLDVDFGGALFITATGALSVLIGITPANLGITEGFAIVTGWVLGITTAQSLAAALIRRIVSTLVIFTLGPVFSYLLLKNNPLGTRKET